MTESQGAQAPATTPSAAPVSFADIQSILTPKMPVPDTKEPEPVVSPPIETPDTDEEPLAAKPAKEDLVKELRNLKKKTDEKGAKTDAPQPKPERTFKVAHGDQSFDVKPDAKLSVKVDGKEEEVKFQDLVDNYSGKTNWSRKFQEVAQEKKGLQETINTLYDSFVTKGDALGGIEVLVDALGGNPIEVRQQVTETLLKQMDSLASLSPEEREMAKLRDELSYRKQRDELERTKSQQAKVVADLKARLETVQKTFGLTEEQLVQTYDELKQLNVTDAQIEANPEVLGEYHRAKEKQIKERETDTGVTQMLKDIDAEFESDEERTEATGKLKKAMELYPDMTLTELKDYAIEAYGSRSSKNLARKLKRSQPTNTAKPVERTREPINFDDL